MSFLLDDSKIPSISNIYIMLSHQPGGGIVKVAVVTKTGNKIRTKIDCSKRFFPASSINTIVENVVGPVEIQVYDSVGNCLVNAIIVECSSCSL